MSHKTHLFQLSERFFTHASPTLFNAGTPHPQLSSCFLVSMKDDSIDGIYDVCHLISKYSFILIKDRPSRHARKSQRPLAASASASTTFVPQDRTSQERTATRTALFPCSVSTTTPPDTSTKVATSVLARLRFTLSHGLVTLFLLNFAKSKQHADIFDFIDLRKNHGKEEVRARDLFYALWIPGILSFPFKVKLISRSLHETRRTERRLVTVLPS